MTPEEAQYTQGYDEPQPMPNMMAGQLPAQLNEGILQYQTESDALLQKIENTLKGRVYVTDEASGCLKLTPSNPRLRLMSDEGIAVFMLELQMMLDKVNQFTDLDEDYINKTAIQFGKCVNDTLADHMERYGVKHLTHASMVSKAISSLVYANLRKSKEKNYLRFLGTIGSINEHTIQRVIGNNQGPLQRGGGGSGSAVSKIPLFGKMFK